MSVMPAQAGIQRWRWVETRKAWIPAFAGKTKGKQSKLPVDANKIPRLIAEGCLIRLDSAGLGDGKLNSQ